MMFNVGDKVEWTSQAAGTTRVKVGEVLEVVPPWTNPRTRLREPRFWRDHVSYVVRAVALGRKSGRASNYWPRVSALRPASPGGEGGERDG